jgi:hypothetical protein
MFMRLQNYPLGPPIKNSRGRAQIRPEKIIAKVKRRNQGRGRPGKTPPKNNKREIVIRDYMDTGGHKERMHILEWTVIGLGALRVKRKGKYKLTDEVNDPDANYVHVDDEIDGYLMTKAL